MSVTVLRTAQVFVPFVDEEIASVIREGIPLWFVNVVTIPLTDTAERAQQFAKESTEKKLGYFERVSRVEAVLSRSGFKGWMVSLDITED